MSLTHYALEKLGRRGLRTSVPATKMPESVQQNPSTVRSFELPMSASVWEQTVAASSAPPYHDVVVVKTSGMWETPSVLRDCPLPLISDHAFAGDLGDISIDRERVEKLAARTFGCALQCSTIGGKTAVEQAATLNERMFVDRPISNPSSFTTGIESRGGRYLPRSNSSAANAGHAVVPPIEGNVDANLGGYTSVPENSNIDEFSWNEHPYLVEALMPARRPETEFEIRIHNRLADKLVGRQCLEMVDHIAELLAVGKPHAVLAVSSEPEEHVPQVIATLGLLLSQRKGQEIILVDGNEQREAGTSLSANYELETSIGLSEVFQGTTDWREAVVATSNDLIHVLPAGRRCPPQIPGNARLKELVELWKKPYPCVLIDGGSGDSRFATAWSRVCDLTCLVIRLGSASMERTISIVEELTTAGGKTIGCVVTNSAESG